MPPLETQPQSLWFLRLATCRGEDLRSSLVQMIAVVAFLGGTAGVFQEAGRGESKRRKETFFLVVQRKGFLWLAERSREIVAALSDAVPDCWVGI